MLEHRKLMAFLATADAPRAVRFYRDTLGLTLTADEEWALVFRAGDTMLRVQKVRDVSPAPFTVLGWHVSDIAADVAALAARGVSFERFGFLEQDAAGVWTAPGGARVAWFKDPDGNLLSMTEGVD